MKTIINIDGGVGRIIAAIPALLKYGRLHPDEDWYAMIPGWDIMTWSIPELQARTFNPETKGMFENYYWDADKVIAPEPYKLPAFYRNEISLREAFDRTINQTEDHSDLPDLTIKLSLDEIIRAKEIIRSVKKDSNKKIIIFQPYGSTSQYTELGVYDKSMRSINHYMTKKLCEKLIKDYIVISMNEWCQEEGVVTLKPDPDLRTWAAIIQEADYFIGCDSCGQHMAKALGTPASVLIAGTHEVAISYPETFHIIKREGVKFYPGPMRVSNINSMLTEKLNEERNAFTDEEIDAAYKEIVKRISKVGKNKSEVKEELKNTKGFAK